MQTNVLIGLSTTQEPAFQIAADGEITARRLPCLTRRRHRGQRTAGVTDMQEAPGHHLFLKAGGRSAELEAPAGWLARARSPAPSLDLPSFEARGSLDQPTRAAGLPRPC